MYIYIYLNTYIYTCVCVYYGTRMDGSYHTHIHESCHLTSLHIRMSHVSHTWTIHVTHMDEPCHAYVDESCHAYKCIMARI